MNYYQKKILKNILVKMNNGLARIKLIFLAFFIKRKGLKNMENKKSELKNKNGKVIYKIMTKGLLIMVYVVLLNILQASQVFATDDPLAVINNLSTFMFGIIRAIGMIMLGWGIVQVGLALKSHDASQRANGFLTVAGGVIITFAKEILAIITGG